MITKEYVCRWKTYKGCEVYQEPETTITWRLFGIPVWRRTYVSTPELLKKIGM